MAMKADEEEVPLQEFVQTRALPQTVKVTEGCVIEQTEIDDEEDIEMGFPTGDVITLLQVVYPKEVILSFCDEGSGCDQNVKVSADLGAKFYMLPFDPVSFDTSQNHVFPTVEDLVQSCPLVIRAGCSYKSDESSKRDLFCAGDRMKLTRLVNRDRIQYLECKLIKNNKVILLPMDCVGNFTALPIARYFTIIELLNFMPRPRRLRLGNDIINERIKIPGLPRKYPGDIFLDCPKAVVEVCHPENPGDVSTLPIDWDMIVSPRDDTYSSGPEMRQQYLLSQFIQSNISRLPMKVRVMDWDEETSAMENHQVRPGTDMNIFKCEPIQKIFVKSSDTCYAVPLCYAGSFCIIPKTFVTVAEIEKEQPSYKLKVEVGAPCNIEGLGSLVPGDILKFIGTGEFCPPGGNRDEHIDTVRFQRYNPKPCDIFEVPLYIGGSFVEAIGDQQCYTLKDLVSTKDLPVMVEQKETNEYTFDDISLPSGEPLTISSCGTDPCVITCTRESYLFHLPLRSKLYIVFVEKLDKNFKKSLKNQTWSPWNSCAEIIAEETFSLLVSEGKLYDELERETIPFLPPKTPRDNKPVVPPRRKTMEKRSISAPSGLPEATPKAPPRPPRRTLTDTPATIKESVKELANKFKGTLFKERKSGSTEDQTVKEEKDYDRLRAPFNPGLTSVSSHTSSSDEDAVDYEEVDDDMVDSYDYVKTLEIQEIHKRGKINIPKNGNLYHFDVNEMMTFFTEMKISDHNLTRMRSSEMDGKKFSTLTDTDMRMYGILDNIMVQHFRKKTKKTSKVVNFLHKIV